MGDILPQRLREGTIGETDVFVERAEQDDGTIRVGASRHLRRQAAFADARFATKQHGAGGPLDGRPPRPAQPIQDLRASEQGGLRLRKTVR